MEEKNIFEQIENEQAPTQVPAPTGAQVASPDLNTPANSETVEEKTNKDIGLDDLDNVAKKDKVRKINYKEDIPKELTVESVELGKAKVKTLEGVHIPPEKNKTNGGEYYKAKLIVNFKEEVNETRVRDFIPSIFYSVDEQGNVAKIPNIPNACSDEKLTHKFTGSLAKLRNKYCKFVGKDPKDVSSKEFVKGLTGKKFKVTRIDDDYNGKDWSKIELVDFIQ